MEKIEKDKIKILHSIDKTNNLRGLIYMHHINFDPKSSQMAILERI